MSKYLSDYNLKVLTNVISGVESYGQQYSTERRWDAWANAYTNSSAQHSITIGWAQNYGDSALELLKYIQKKYPAVFAKYDTADIATDIKRASWVSQPYYQITKTSAKGKAIIAIITTPQGKKCQDDFFQIEIQLYLEAAKTYGLTMTNVHALMMWCEIRHLGGLGPTKRIFNRCGKNPTLDQIMAALKQDQNDTSNSNQVGDAKFQSRHDCCYKWIKQYAHVSNTQTQTTEEEVKKETETQPTPVVEKKEEDNKVNMSVDFSKYYNKISNSGGDERGDITGGTAGDQTGNEWNIRNWYSRPWTCVLRHPDKEVRELIAELGIQAANNNKIGYDQNQRGTYWTQLKNSGYRPSKITVACEADCSAGVIANTRAAGYLLNRNELKNVNADYTGNMRSGYKAAGFQVLTDSKYLTSSAYLIPGDILLYDGHHTATNLGIGSKSGYKQDETPTPTPDVQPGQIPTYNGGSYSQTVVKTGKVTAYLLNARKGPGKSYANLVSYPTLTQNTQVGICMQVKASDGKMWYYIKISGSKGDKFGFVSSQYIEVL